VFAHCCKFSDCKTMEMATRCKLGALSHLAQAHVGAPLKGRSQAHVGAPLEGQATTVPSLPRLASPCITPHLPFPLLNTRRRSAPCTVSHATAAATPLTHTTLPPVHRAAGFKQLIKDARLELKVYDITQMTRLFNLKGGAKVRTRTPCPAHMRHTRTLRGEVAERRDQRAVPTPASSSAVPGSSAGGRGHLKTVAFHRGRVSVGSSRAQLERSPYARAPWPRPRVAAGLTTARPSPSLGRARRCGGCPGWRLSAPGLGHGDGLGHARRERTYALSGRGALRELADPLSCWGRVVLALWRATC
jgi:hypothetical protein